MTLKADKDLALAGKKKKKERSFVARLRSILRIIFAGKVGVVFILGFLCPFCPGRGGVFSRVLLSPFALPFLTPETALSPSLSFVVGACAQESTNAMFNLAGLTGLLVARTLLSIQVI